MTAIPMQQARLFTWFQAHSTDSALRFREQTIRILIACLLTADLLAFAFSTIFYGVNSYTVMETLTALFLVAAAVAVHRNQVSTASYFLTAPFVILMIFLAVNSELSSTIGIPFSICALQMVALTLPRKIILPLAALASTVNVVAFALNPAYRDTLAGWSMTALLFIWVSAFMIYIMRREFDQRLDATEQARNIAERERAAAEQSRLEAERANTAKDQFLSIMSHELRTPLGAIIGFVGILQAGMIKDRREALPLSKTQQDMLKSVRENANHLLLLINTVLDLAKVSSGRMVARFARIAPTDPAFIESTVTGLQSLAIGRNVDLTLEFAPNLPELVTCDTMQIKQIVKNLVGNALKFTDKGEVRVNVSGKSASMWQIVVQDTGVGIPPDRIAHIFDRFYQVDTSDTRPREGTGLGLAIVKGYIELHGGKVEVQSAPGLGSTFTVMLPVHMESEPAAQ